VVPDDKLGIVGLADDPARERPGRLGAEPAEGTSPSALSGSPRL
jgi:hypothetical protein